MKIKIITLIALTFSGCTLSERKYLNGEVARSVSFIQASAESCSKGDLFAEELTSLGLWIGAVDGGIGYKQSRRICGMRDCQLVLWPSPSFDIKKFEEKFGPLDKICSKTGG